jgi:hypothetical protein
MKWSNIEASERDRLVKWLRDEAQDADKRVEDNIEPGPSDGPNIRAMADQLARIEAAPDTIAQILAAIDEFMRGLDKPIRAKGVMEQARAAMGEMRAVISKLAPAPAGIEAVTSDPRWQSGELWAQPNILRWKGIGLTVMGREGERHTVVVPLGPESSQRYRWCPELDELSATWRLREPGDILAERE